MQKNKKRIVYHKNGSYEHPRLYFVVVVVVVVVKKSIVHQLGHFTGKDGHFYTLLPITGAFLNANVTNSTYPEKTGLFRQKKVINLH